MTIKTLILDLEGVLYRFEQPISGAHEAVDLLRKHNFRLHFLTNASVRTAAETSQKLRNLGFDVEPSEITTSASTLAQCVAAQYPHGPILLVGSEALREEFDVLSLPYTLCIGSGRTPEQVFAAVAMGFDQSFNYDTLIAVQQAILKGAKLFVSDRDAVYPHGDSIYPGTEWQVAAVVSCTGTSPTITGKPSPDLLNNLLATLGSKQQDTMIVGDSLWSDIAFASGTDCYTCQVRTGVPIAFPTPARSQEAPIPTLIVDSLLELAQLLVGDAKNERP